MQAIQLIELATVVVFYAEQFMDGTASLNAPAFERYWQHSKSRLHRWRLAMRAASSRKRLEGDVAAFFGALVEEVLAADVLNRVWTTVGYSIHSTDLADHAKPFLQSVFAGHAEVRNQLLTFLADAEASEKLTRRIDRNRHLAESWTDLLLAFLPAPAAELHAFDRRRLADYRRSIDSPAYRQDTLRRIVSNVKSSPRTFSEICPHENLNRLVTHSITAALGPDLLDSVGPFKDLWQVRLSLGTQDTLHRVEVLLAEDSH